MNNTSKSKFRQRLLEVRKRNTFPQEKNTIKQIKSTTKPSSLKTNLPNMEHYYKKEKNKPENKIKIIFINKNKDKDITSLKELTLPDKNNIKEVKERQNSSLKQNKVITVKPLPKVFKENLKEVKNKSVSHLILKNKEVKKIVVKKKEENQKKELEGQILKRLAKRFTDNLNELEIINSQLFFLDLKDQNNLDEINETISKIKEILKRIENLKKEYLKLKENYDFDNIIEFEDKFIVDDILAYRNLVDNRKEDIVKVMKEYRKIEEYKLLYDHLKYAEKETKSIKDKLSKQKEEISIKDLYYHDIKVKTQKIDNISKSSKRYLDVQQNYLTNILQNVKKINTKERTNYFFAGFSRYFTSGLEYLSLLMLKPFRGNTLSMALNISAAKKMVSDARSSIKLESMTRLVYEAYDYKDELRKNLTDLEYLNNNIEDTLNNINNLKEDFQKMFVYYQNNPKYKEITDRISKVEKVVLANQKYLKKIESQNKEADRLNEEKLIKVKRLNNLSIERRNS